MKPLTPVNKPIRDVIDTFQPGMVIVMADGEKFLIGGVAPDTSTCHGCSTREHDKDIVLGYYTIDWDVPAAILEPLKITDIVAGARILVRLPIDDLNKAGRSSDR